jgi:hypothetical protein
MSGWIKQEYGNVKMELYSTSSLVKMILTMEEEVSPGRWEMDEEIVWLDYTTFSNLKNLINQIQFPL